MQNEKEQRKAFYIQSEDYKGIKGIIKKCIYKLVAWIIVPFGERQNMYNQQFLDRFCREHEYIENLCVTMKKLEDDFQFKVLEEQNRIEEKVDNIELELLDRIEFGKKALYLEADSIRAEINPKIRLFKDINKSEVFLDINHELKENILLIARKGKDAHVEDFAKLTNIYENEISFEINRIKKQNIIVIVCMGFKNLQGMEAIRKEAYQLYLLFKRFSKYSVRLVSVENQKEDILETGDFVYLKSNLLKSFLERIKPRLVVVEEATAFFAGSMEYFENLKTLYRTGAQNPLQGIPEHIKAELMHLEDLGLFSFMVQSKYASKVMVDFGFHTPILSYPVINKNQFYVNRKVNREKHEIFKIGFASSPIDETQMEDRGMKLLEEVVNLCPQFQFVILWRKKELEVPKGIIKAENCSIHYGTYNMKRFYDEIDCLVIPYATTNNNHACSHSALEAALNAVPVVATNVSGVSEVVSAGRCGIVCEAMPVSIVQAINEICDNFARYSNIFYAELVYHLLDEKSIVYQIEQIASQEFTVPAITLKEWDRQLREHGRYLVKGPENIKRYYEQFEIADAYTKERFLEYPWNCFDELERASIRAIFNQKFVNRNPDILDIASGDGRIVQECLRFGNCTAVDNSKAMLSIVENRFLNNEKLSLFCADYFETEISGKYDVITTFRYVRHFEYKLRRKLYQKIRDNLKANGMLILDIPNRKLEVSMRGKQGWYNYNIYDVFSTPENIKRELEENGFFVEYIIPVGAGLLDNQVKDDELIGEPITWTVGAMLSGNMES